MATPMFQFVLGFAISFAPAPVVGFATYALVNGGERPTAVVLPRQYGAPLGFEHESPATELAPGSSEDGEMNYSVSPSAGPMEVETDCARRKRLRKQKADPTEPPRKKPPERPDI